MKTWLTLFITCSSIVWAPSTFAVFPDKNIRIVVPAPPGNGMDIVARLLSEGMSNSWGQSVIIDNKVGGGGTVGMVAGREAVADGHTFTFGSSGSMAINPNLGTKLPYDVREFTLVNGVYLVPLTIVVKDDSPFRSLADVLKFAKQFPGKLTWAYAGPTQQLVGELIKLQASTDITGIMYKGSAPAATDLLGGHVPLLIDTVSALLPHLRSGRARAIAVTSVSRLTQLPQIPTVAESGFPNFEGVGWSGIVVPKGTPAAAVEKISVEVRRQLNDPKMVQRLLDQGFLPDPRPADTWKQFVEAESIKWLEVIKKTGIKGD